MSRSGNTRPAYVTVGLVGSPAPSNGGVAVTSEEHALVERFVAARRHPNEAVLEGFHALKHALRFGAEILEVVVLTGTDVADLPVELVEAETPRRPLPERVFDRVVTSRPPVPVAARASRPVVTVTDALAGAAPAVLLERPKHLGNVGAAIRVAAAAGAAGVVVTGEADPWHPRAIRGGAGLHYALPVVGVETMPPTDRPLVAFDPTGTDLRAVACPERALLAFGTERTGLSPPLLQRADLVVAIPMRPRVSSLNLATAVAVGLYTFGAPPPR